MLGSIRRRLAFVMAATLASCFGTAPVTASQPTMISASPRVAAASTRSLVGAGRTLSLYGRRGAGITMAQQQRAATKKRGVARNRRHHR